MLGAPRSVEASRRIARRALVRSLVAQVGRALCIACGVSLAMVGAAKVWALPEWWGVAIGVPPFVGLAIGAALAWRERWSLIQAAAAADVRLETGDTLRSAIELHDREKDPFVRIAIDRGEAAAFKVVASDVVPSVRHGSWLICASLATASVLVWVLVPAVTHDLPRTQTTAKHVAEALEDVRQAAAAIAPKDDVRASPSAPTTSQVEELRALEQELATGQIDPTAARARAAEALSEAADREAARISDMQRSADTARARLAKAARSPGAAGETGEAGELRRALATGDVQAAVEAVERLRSQTPRLTPEERAKLAEDLDDLASAVEEQQRPPLSQEGENERSEQSPDSSGSKPEVPPAVESQSDRAPEQDVRESLREASRALRGEEKKDSPHSVPPRRTSATPQGDSPADDKPDDRRSNSKPDATQSPSAKDSETGNNTSKGQPNSVNGDEQGASRRDNDQPTQTKPSPSGLPTNPSISKSDAKTNNERTTPPMALPSPSTPTPPTGSPQTGQSPKTDPGNDGERREATRREGSRPESENKGREPSTNPPKEASPGSKPDATRDRKTTPDGSTSSPPAPSPQQAPAQGEKNTSPSPADAKGAPEKPPAQAPLPSDSKSSGAKPQEPESRDGRTPHDREHDPKPTSTPKKAPGTPRESPPRDTGEPNAGQRGDTTKQPENPSDSRPPNLPDNLPPMPKMSDKALEQVAKRLRDIGKNLEKDPPSQQQIDRWRKQAEDLLEKSTPEQREQLQRLAKKLAKDMPDQQGEDTATPRPPSPAPSASGDPSDRSSPEQESQDDGKAPSTRDGMSPHPGTPDPANRLRQSGGEKPPNSPDADASSDARQPPTARDNARRNVSPAGSGTGAGSAETPRRIGPTPQPWTSQTETVDARPKSTPKGSTPRVLAEVLNPDGPSRRSSSSEPSLSNELREAAKGAERAIEQQGIPNARTEYIRRVIRRYTERASPGNFPELTTGPTKPAPTPDATDASKIPK